MCELWRAYVLQFKDRMANYERRIEFWIHAITRIKPDHGTFPRMLDLRIAPVCLNIHYHPYFGYFEADFREAFARIKKQDAQIVE